MKPRHAISSISNLALVINLASTVVCHQFSSRVSVNTPAWSYSHGVGDPISVAQRRSEFNWNPFTGLTNRRESFAGYPRMRPARPFLLEDVAFNDNSLSSGPQYDGYYETITVLPPSPYKVDSPDPESLWPDGLFNRPAVRPPKNAGYSEQFDPEVLSATDPLDPYLVEGSAAIAAVARAKNHGIYYFHDIPHIHSLLANNKLRFQNHLQPHRVGSIRHTWPFNRP